MKKKLRQIGLTLGLTLATTVGSMVFAANTGNPIILNAADPTAAIFNGKYYVYPTSNGGVFHGYSSLDLSNWIDAGPVFDATKLPWTQGNNWAPSIIQKNGTYYFYFCDNLRVGVATGTSPTGPFTDAVGGPLITGNGGTEAIDPYPLIDDDGQAYLYYGGGGGSTIAVYKLNSDLISLNGAQVPIAATSNRGAEASVAFKRKGIYYLIWSQGNYSTDNYHLEYATASAPMGPFTYQGSITQGYVPGVQGWGSNGILHYPGSDTWYLLCHGWRNGNANAAPRDTWIEPLVFNADGTIPTVYFGETTGVPTNPLPTTASVASPVFSPLIGTYSSPQSVTITSATSGATIYYTTDGTVPTTSSPIYSGAFTVSSTQTIQALAVASGLTNSYTASATYTITGSTPTAATPTFSPAGGTYNSAQSVTLSDSTSGATIYYTTDGSTPTTSSTSYTGTAITVNSTETIKALAVASGYTNSAVGSATYTISSGSTGLVDGGIYTFTPQNATGLRLTVQGGGSGNPVNVDVETASTGYTAQQWVAHQQTDGSFQLSPQCASNEGLECVGVDNGGSGTNVDIWTAAGNGTDSHWTATQVSGSIYTLTPGHNSGLKLNVQGAGTASGTNVDIETNSSATSQQWQITQVTPPAANLVDGGIYTFTPQNATGLRLTVQGGGSGNPVNVDVETASTGSTAQQWVAHQQTDGSFQLSPQCASSEGLECVGVDNGGSGTNVDIWTAAGNGTDSHWTLTQVSGSIYTLTPGHNGSVKLNVQGAGTASGTNVDIETASGATNQQWQLTQISTGPVAGVVYELEPQNAPGTRLDVSNGGGSGTNVQIYTSNGGVPQGWTFSQLSDGSYSVIPQCSTTSSLECAGVDNGGSGDNVDIWTSNGNGIDSHWTLTQVSPGIYTLTPGHNSSLRLNVQGAGTADSTNVDVETANSATSQQWKLIQR